LLQQARPDQRFCERYCYFTHFAAILLSDSIEKYQIADANDQAGGIRLLLRL